MKIRFLILIFSLNAFWQSQVAIAQAPSVQSGNPDCGCQEFYWEEWMVESVPNKLFDFLERHEDQVVPLAIVAMFSIALYQCYQHYRQESAR